MKSFRSPGANAVALLCAAAFLAGAQFLKTAPRQTVEVEDGQISPIEIVTDPYKTPTPEATP